MYKSKTLLDGDARIDLFNLHRQRPVYPFDIVARERCRRIALTALNRGPAPVWVTLDLSSAQNVRATGPRPWEALVAPAAEQILAWLEADNPDRRFTYLYCYQWSVGPAHSASDPRACYLLPFGRGQRFRVTQAPGGRCTTHTAAENRYAIDLAMPPGSLVCAARAGTVIEAIDGFGEGRPDPAFVERANLVRILHADGTLAEYVHLLQDSLAVAAGDCVTAGQILGRSGNSGYSSGPHLHFNVQVKQGHAFCSTPFVFTEAGRPLVPVYGGILESGPGSVCPPHSKAF